MGQKSQKIGDGHLWTVPYYKVNSGELAFFMIQKWKVRLAICWVFILVVISDASFLFDVEFPFLVLPLYDSFFLHRKCNKHEIVVPNYCAYY